MEIEGFYEEVIVNLDENDVEFLLVGGLAVGFYGYARFTGDMDLWINPSTQNLKKLEVALQALGFASHAIESILEARPIDHPTPIRLFSEDDRFKVDLMTTIYYEPLTFQACYERAQILAIGKNRLRVIGIKDLIDIKSNVQRADGNIKDLVDAHELRKILERRDVIDIGEKESFIRRLIAKFRGI